MRLREQSLWALLGRISDGDRGSASRLSATGFHPAKFWMIDNCEFFPALNGYLKATHEIQKGLPERGETTCMAAIRTVMRQRITRKPNFGDRRPYQKVILGGDQHILLAASVLSQLFTAFAPPTAIVSAK